MPRTDLQIEYRAIDNLLPSDRNPRTHSDRQIAQLARSLESFGFVNPILIDNTGDIVAGHGRLAAAKKLGLTRVPTVRLDHMTQAQVQAYRVADNRLAELAGWDESLLALELGELMDLDFDVELTGFELPEIDLMIHNAVDDATQPDDADGAVEPSTDPPISQPGDVWNLGPHRLICGDARSREVLATLMENERAEMIFTDPRYNVRVNGHVSGLGNPRHREFAMASGEMTETEFQSFLQTTLGNAAAVSREGALHFVFIDWRHLSDLQEVAKSVYSKQINLCIWNKTNGGMGSLYRSAHELVGVFKCGSAPHTNNVQLGRHGRNRTNVWSYPGANPLHADRDADLRDHPTVKPTALVADALLDCSTRGSIVLDPFVGSGTIFLAAQRTGRIARGIEIDAAYVDVAIRRWERFTGDQAILADTGKTFSAIRAERRPDAD